MKMKKYFLMILLGTSLHTLGQLKIPPMPNKKIWKDTKGNPINAHGGGLLLHKGTYYWFGEIKQGNTWLVPGQQWEDYRVPAGGISCYSSKDLIKWKFEGKALATLKGQPNHDLDTSKVVERPKVIYNQKTKKFVMWMHVDANDYSYAQTGVAISDKPQGPYKFLGSIKPNGQESRDMTLYKDDDNRAYLIYSSESNKTMQVCLLNDDYLSPTTNYKRITSAQNREAPAVFKYNKKYYLITSDCTGWSPNQSTYAIADSLLGDWKQMSNPCLGNGAKNTFGAQSTYIIPIHGHLDTFLFLADVWNKKNLQDSRYIWLPIKMKENKPLIKWIP
jgi:Glycosyl hydrolases family 43